jgi:hypothetical protein
MTNNMASNINWPRFKADLAILEAEKRRQRFGRSPFTQVEWGYTPGGAVLIIRNLILPPGRCSPERSHLRIEMPPNLYQSVGPGQFAFYRNLWVTPHLKVWDTRTQDWVRAPRLLDRSENGFGYLCIHPGYATEQDNILSVIATLDLHLTNPGLKAGSHEAI